MGTVTPVDVLVGTSGWQYRDWRGAFYPQGQQQRLWLEYYSSRFGTVENNAAFYRLPAPETFTGWRDRVSADFVMAVKASRYLTHVRRLRDPADPVKRLLAAATGLGGKLGPVLLQLPPTMRAEPGLLDECLRQFPPAVRVAVEPRHESWWTDDVRAVLTRRNAALCWADREGTAITPLWRTADWGYLRMHEGDGSPWPRYAARTLRGWADQIASAWPPQRTPKSLKTQRSDEPEHARHGDVYVYFNNDQLCAAPVDAAAFAAVMGEIGGTVGRAQLELLGMTEPLHNIIDAGWADALEPVAGQIAAMGEFLRAEVAAGRRYLPAGEDVLRAFKQPLSDVRVLIVGQDPYPTPGHPIGLSFSVAPDVRPPPSLVNIFREYSDDLGYPTPGCGDLTPWSERGVLLLNRVLTVQPRKSGSHRGKGWEEVTEQAIRALAARNGHSLVAILWGRDARTLVPLLGDVPRIESAHPSPYSAANGFFGSRPFSRANQLLEQHGAEPVDWKLP